MLHSLYVHISTGCADVVKTRETPSELARLRLEDITSAFYDDDERMAIRSVVALYRPLRRKSRLCRVLPARYPARNVASNDPFVTFKSQLSEDHVKLILESMRHHLVPS